MEILIECEGEGCTKKIRVNPEFTPYLCKECFKKSCITNKKDED